MFVTHLVIASILFIGLLISNVLTVVLIAFFVLKDEYSNLQGAHYYIVSLAISDLIFGIVLIPFSITSLSINQWTFGQEVCEFYAYLWLSLWLINIYTFLLLSADRHWCITDKKYCQYKNRTRVRCICQIGLAWSVALSFSFIPASLYSCRLSTILIHYHICIVNWHSTASYFATVIISTVCPCLFGSVINFTKIFYWRIKWRINRKKKKLSAASVLCLVEPTHVVSLILFLVFWSSWLPFTVNIYQNLIGKQMPNVYSFWLGGSQGIWKLPIMITFSPRYRQYFSNFCIKKTTNVTAPNVSSNENAYTFGCNLQLSSKELLCPVNTNDVELHM